MKDILKPHAFISHLVPGFSLLLFIFLSHCNWTLHTVKGYFADMTATQGAAYGFIAIVISFLIGEICDSFRDGIVEWLIEKIRKKKEIKWSFFFEAPEDEINKLQEHFYTWHVFNFNSALSLSIGSVLAYVYGAPLLLKIGMPIGAIILIINAFTLRKEIRELIEKRP